MSEFKCESECVTGTLRENDKYGNYVVSKQLGKGHFGSAYLVKRDSKTYVLKQISMFKPEQIIQVHTEIEILRHIKKNNCKKNILCYTECFVDCNQPDSRIKMNIVTEAFLNAMSLSAFLKKVKKQNRILTNSQVLEIMYNIVDALVHLKNLGIAHNDLKPENMLINPNTFDIQIIDFGVSCLKDDCIYSGTVYYMAPEVLKNVGGVSKKRTVKDTLVSDIFSVGMIFYLLTHLHFPYQIMIEEKQSESISSDSLGSYLNTVEDGSADAAADTVMSDVELFHDYSRENKGISPTSNPMFPLFKYYQKEKIVSSYNSNKTESDQKINNLIENMLAYKPEERPTIDDVLQKITDLRKGMLPRRFSKDLLL